MSAASIRFSELIRRAGLNPLGAGEPDPEICGVTLDSRAVVPGGLFVAARGAEADGAGFVPDAVARGARAVVAESARPGDLDHRVAWFRTSDPRRVAASLSRNFFGCPDEALRVVGVTGTNGKTTVTYLIQSIARAAGCNAGRIGTNGHDSSHGTHPLQRTTPEAPELQALLATMRDEGVELVAIEVSSHSLVLDRVAGMRFAVAALLNIGRDHLDFHGSEEQYFEAKARLFDGLESDRAAVIPSAGDLGRKLARRLDDRGVKFLTFGRDETADVRLIEEHTSLGGSSGILETPNGRLPVRTFLVGRFHMDNVTAAAACALALGLPLEAIAAGVLALESVPGRMEPILCGQPFTVFVDYAHTPEALAAVLEWVRELATGSVVIVFGCGGERDRGKRSAMGVVAARLADRVILTSDNPRREDPQQILDEIFTGVAEIREGPSRCRVILDRHEAIRAALDGAQDGQVTIIAGKGHETAQTSGTRVAAFDDRQVCRETLAALGWRGGRSAQA